MPLTLILFFFKKLLREDFVTGCLSSRSSSSSLSSAESALESGEEARRFESLFCFSTAEVVDLAFAADPKKSRRSGRITFDVPPFEAVGVEQVDEFAVLRLRLHLLDALAEAVDEEEAWGSEAPPKIFRSS